MFKKKLSEWSMLPAEVEVTHFYGTAWVCVYVRKFYGDPGRAGHLMARYRYAINNSCGPKEKFEKAIMIHHQLE
jgi:hypothetical protein